MIKWMLPVLLLQILHLFVNVSRFTFDNAEGWIKRQRARQHLSGERHTQTSGERSPDFGLRDGCQLCSALKYIIARVLLLSSVLPGNIGNVVIDRPS